MCGKCSFVPADENNLTEAETWLEKIDRPWWNKKTPDERVSTDLDRKALRQMKGVAEEASSEASPRHTTLHTFVDGSGLYEKQKDDWFTLDADDVKRLRASVAVGDDGDEED